MVLPLAIPAILVGTTIASIASPFFLPQTEAQKAEIELNNKLKQGNFSIIKNPEPIKTVQPDSFGEKIKQQVDDIKTKFAENKNLGYIALVIIAVIIIMVIK